MLLPDINKLPLNFIIIKYYNGKGTSTKKSNMAPIKA